MIMHEKSLLDFLYKFDVKKDDICMIGSFGISLKSNIKNDDIEFILQSKKRNELISGNTDNITENKYSGTIKVDSHVECQLNPYKMFGITDEMCFEDDYSYILSGYRCICDEIYFSAICLANREKDTRKIELLKKKNIWTPKSDDIVHEYLEIAYNNGWSNTSEKRDENWKKIVSSSDKVYIMGDGNVAKHVYERFKRDNITDIVSGFIVSEKKNKTCYLGKKVFDLMEIDEKTSRIIIAVALQKQASTDAFLRMNGYKNTLQSYHLYV